jgi:hypothetical protein
MQKHKVKYAAIWKVSSKQVYNHLHKWRARWAHVSKLRDQSSAGWDEDTHTIILEDKNYKGMYRYLPEIVHKLSQ